MLDKEDIKIYMEENEDTLKKMFTVKFYYKFHPIC